MRLSPFIKPIFYVTGINRDNSHVDIGDSDLHVKMGPWFDDRLPIDQIAGVERSDWPWYGGLGTKLGPGKGGVSVVGSRDGIVAVRFKTPQRVRLWIVVTDIAVDCTELRVALEEPDEFIRTIEDLRRKW